MSVIWGVLPLEPTLFREWLESKGITVPDQPGRYPTLDETLNVLKSIDDLSVSKEQVTENLWDLVVGELASDTYANLVGNVEDDNTFDFHFDKGSQETTMLEILKCLSQKCGPLVLFDHYSATPVLVTSNTIVSVALKEWYQRMNA